MKVTQGETKDRQTVLHIEVDDDLLDQHMNRAHQRLASRLNVPGFRKGKAPRSVVERFVGREHLVEEALESLVPAAVEIALDEQDLQASATPRVTVVERDPTVKLDATVPLPPEATLGDYSGIHFDDTADEVSDEDVEDSVRRLLEASAEWNDVERPLQAGDLVTFTATGTVDGTAFFEQTDAEYLADDDNPNPVPGFSASLVGIEPGGAKDFSIELPGDFSREELAGKTAEFTVSVSKIREKDLPELTDELVKGLGEGINTVADLRSRIRENLEARAQHALRESLEEKVVDELVGRSEFELSPLMLEHEAEHVLRDQQNALARYNISFDQFLAQSGKSGEEILEDAKQTAESRVKRTLVMDLLAESEGIDPTDEEVEKELSEWSAQHDGHGHEDDPEAAKSSVISVLKRRKAIDRAIELATTAQNGTKATATKSRKSKSAGTAAAKNVDEAPVKEDEAAAAEVDSSAEDEPAGIENAST